MKLLYTLSAAAMVFLMSACSGGNQIKDIEAEYFPVMLSGEKSWGMVSQDGEILYESEFKNAPSNVFNGIFAVKEGDGYSLYYADKKPRLVPGCEKLVATGLFFADDYAPIVRKEKRITVINRDGEEMFILSPQKGKEIITSNNGFTDGMLVVMNEDGKLGAFNHNGVLSVPCKYDNVSNFSEGYALAVTNDTNGDKAKYQIIDHEGNVVQTIKNCRGGFATCTDGKFPIQINDDRCAFATVDGDIIKCPKDVASIIDFNGDYYLYLNTDFSYMGLMEYNDEGGEMVIKATKYTSLTPLDKSWSKFLAYMDEEYRIIDREGETLVKLDDYKYVSVLSQSAKTLIAEEGSYYILLDSEGKPANKKLEVKEFGFHTSFPSIASDLPKARKAASSFGIAPEYEECDTTVAIVATEDWAPAVEGIEYPMGVEESVVEENYYDAPAAEGEVVEWDYAE